MRLRLVTYNIHRAIGIDRKFAPQRIIDILSHYEADIVLLQDVDRDVPRSQHLDLSHYLQRHLQYEHRAIGMDVYLKKEQYGNVTLSRYPIGRQRNIDLTIGRHKQRGAQHTQIELPKTFNTLDIFNVHLGLTAQERRRQLERLLTTKDLALLGLITPCIYWR